MTTANYSSHTKLISDDPCHDSVVFIEGEHWCKHPGFMSPRTQNVCLLHNHYHSLQFGGLAIITAQKIPLTESEKNLGGRTTELLLMSSLSK